MPITDARPVPRKNAAFCFSFALRDVTTNQLITSWTGMDSEVSLDRGAFTDCTNEAVEIGTSGVGYIELTAAEMDADTVIYKLTVSNANSSPLVITFYPEEAGDYRAAVTSLGNDVITSAAIAASALNNKGNWNVGKTGYSLVQLFPTNFANTDIDISGRVLLQPVQTGVIIPTVTTVNAFGGSAFISINSLEASAFIQDTVLGRIDSALEYDGVEDYRWTAASLIHTPLDWTVNERTVFRNVLGIPTSGTTALDPTVGILDTIRDLVIVVDNVVDAITAKTTNLPADPASASTIAASFVSLNNNVTVIPAATLNTIVENGLTVLQCIRLANSVLFGASTGMNTSPVFKSLDGNKNRVVATITGDARTVSSRDGT